MSFDLIVYDVDGVLCELRPLLPVEKAGSVEAALKIWKRKTMINHPAPRPHGLALVRTHAEAFPKAARVVLTGRNCDLRVPTVRFLTLHYGELEDAVLSMAPADQPAHALAHESKTARLARLRERFSGPMLLVDDDEAMGAACARGDAFIHVGGY